MKPALGIETFADKLEKEYVWIADWMTVPSEKIAAIEKVIKINRKVRKETEDYREIKEKIVDELLFYLDSPGANKKLRFKSADGVFFLLDRMDKDRYFYPLMEPLLYLPLDSGDFVSSQIRQKIFSTLYKIDPCNSDLYDALSAISVANINPGEKILLKGFLASIQLECRKPTANVSSLLRDEGWASASSFFLVDNSIPPKIMKKLKILKDASAPYRKRAEIAMKLGKIKKHKFFVLKKLLAILKDLLPKKREENTHNSYIRLNILFSLPKLRLCYSPMIKVMNEIWSNKYVSTLERSIAAGIIGKYNLHCTRRIKKTRDLKK